MFLIRSLKTIRYMVKGILSFVRTRSPVYNQVNLFLELLNILDLRVVKSYHLHILVEKKDLRRTELL